VSFWLYINKKPVDKADSLEETKKLAQSYIKDKQPLIIESLGAPDKIPPLQRFIWKYDYDKNIWVEEIIYLIVCGGI
jgi:hypothetical protein